MRPSNFHAIGHTVGRQIHGRDDDGERAAAPTRPATASAERLPSRPATAHAGSPAPRGTDLLSRLPDELKLQTLRHLDGGNLLQVSRVSRGMQALVMDTPELRSRLVADTKFARDNISFPVDSMSASLLKNVRCFTDYVSRRDLQRLANETADALTGGGRSWGVGRHHLAKQERLAALAGVLIGTGRLGEQGDSELAQAVAQATPRGPRGTRSLLARRDRSQLMARALVNVESSDPARYEPLTARLSHLQVEVRPADRHDASKLDELPPSVVAKVNKYR